MVQAGVDRRDSYGESINHKLDYMIGNREHGQLVQLDRANRPLPIAVAELRQATSIAYEASRVVKTTPGVVYGLAGYNSKASAQFIQLYDAISLPAEDAVPVFVLSVGASSNFSVDFGIYGRKFAAGIVIGNSSTGPTKTIGSADCFFDIGYV